MATKLSFDVTVDVDGQLAAAHIDELKAQLEELKNKRIGLEIDGGEARVKLQGIKDQLVELQNKHPNIEVRVDAARARAELEAIRDLSDRMERKQLRIEVDDGGSAEKSKGKLNLLLAAGAALGPGIIPVAAAVAAAIAAIGTGAVVGIAALGTVGLGFANVGGAVKELEAAQNKGAATAATAAAQQVSSANSIANAQDALGNAVQNVGVAQAAAAQSVRRAQEQVVTAHLAVRSALEHQVTAHLGVQHAVEQETVAQQGLDAAVQHEQNSERSLIDAQRGALRAQLDLTQSRVDAERALQDMAFSVADNALAQQRAQLDLQVAQKALLNIAATDPRRAGAELTLAEQQQRITELATQGRRLADDKKKADAQGVEGSKTVTSAQNALITANERVVTAQQAVHASALAVTQAHRGVRDSIVALTQAQQAERDSVDSVAQARTRETDAINAVGLAESAGARQVQAARQAVTSATRSLADAQAQAAASTASLAAAHVALTESFDKLSPAGQAFAHFVQDELKPQLLDIQHIAQQGLLPGVEAGLRAAMPVLPQVKGLVGDVATELGGMAKRTGEALNSPFWRGFIGFVDGEAGPSLRTFGTVLGNLATGGAAILMAFKPVWDQMGAGLKNWSDRFATLSQGLSSNPAFQNFLAYVRDNGPIVAKLLGDLVMLSVNVGQALAGYGGALLIATEKLAAFLNWLSQASPIFSYIAAGVVLLVAVWGKLSTVVSVASKAFDLFFAGGITAKLEAAALSAGVFTEKITGSAAAGEKVAATGSKVAGALGKIGAALPLVGVAVVGLSLLYDHFVVSASDAATAILKGGAAAEQAQAQVKAYAVEAPSWAIGYGVLRTKMSDVTDEAKRQRDAMDPLARAQSDATRAQNDYLLALDRGGPTSAAARDAAGRFSAATADVTRQQGLLKTGLESTTDALRRQSDQILGLDESDIRYRDTLANATAAVAQNGRTVDLNTDGGRRNQQMLIDLTRAGQVQEDAMRANGSTAAQLTARHEELRQQFFRVAQQMGYNTNDAQRLTDKYYGIPNRIDTNFLANTFPAVDAVNRMAADITRITSGIQDEKVVISFTGPGTVAGQIAGLAGSIPRAMGGPIHGPGTATSDSVLARLSAGEHVWTAAEVQGAGGHSGVEALRGQAAAGRLPGYAAGGQVTTFDAAGTGDVVKRNAGYIHDALAASPLGAVTAGGGAFNLPGGGVERWRSTFRAALLVAGQGLDNDNRGLFQMQTESGGNPAAVNLYDINAQHGTPSYGLMQIIGPTYARWHHPAFNAPPFAYGVSGDPMSNILASIRYTLGAYGSLAAGWQGHGYANGGIITQPTVGLLGESGPEVVLPLNRPDQARSLMSQTGMGGSSVNVGPVYVSSDVDVDQLAHRLAFASSAAGF